MIGQIWWSTKDLVQHRLTGDGPGLGAEDVGDELAELAGDERRVADGQLVQDAAQRPQVAGAAVGAALLKKLRRHVARRPTANLHLGRDAVGYPDSPAVYWTGAQHAGMIAQQHEGAGSAYKPQTGTEDALVPQDAQAILG